MPAATTVFQVFKNLVTCSTTIENFSHGLNIEIILPAIGINQSYLPYLSFGIVTVQYCYLLCLSILCNYLSEPIYTVTTQNNLILALHASTGIGVRLCGDILLI